MQYNDSTPPFEYTQDYCCYSRRNYNITLWVLATTLTVICLVVWSIPVILHQCSQTPSSVADVFGSAPLIGELKYPERNHQLANA